MANRTSERELIEPALRLLAEPQNLHRGLATEDLAKRLRQAAVPTAEDLQILPSRKDDRLSQVIRNLISHRTLEKRGLATYTKDPLTNQGRYVLTELGRGTLAANRVQGREFPVKNGQKK